MTSKYSCRISIDFQREVEHDTLEMTRTLLPFDSSDVLRLSTDETHRIKELVLVGAEAI